MKEWRIVTAISAFLVSNLGNVKNNKTGELIKPKYDKSNCSLFIYYKLNKYYIHRLVAVEFLPKPLS